MCDPVTAAAMAMAAGGAGLDAFGKYSAGKTSQALGNLKASIADLNAKTLNRQADLVAEGADLAWAKANVTDARISRAGDMVLSAQRHQAASRYFDPNYGSPLVIAQHTAEQIESDREINQANAAIEYADTLARVATLRGQALGQIGAAGSARIGGASAMMAARIGVATSFLKLGASMAGQFSGAPGGGAPAWDDSNAFFANQPSDL